MFFSKTYNTKIMFFRIFRKKNSSQCGFLWPRLTPRKVCILLKMIYACIVHSCFWKIRSHHSSVHNVHIYHMPANYVFLKQKTVWNNAYCHVTLDTSKFPYCIKSSKYFIVLQFYFSGVFRLRYSSVYFKWVYRSGVFITLCNKQCILSFYLFLL